MPMVGSTNRDPKGLPEPGRFDIRREPNPHIAFGHGIHSCLDAALARMEARIARGDFLRRVPELELAETTPWLHVHGPASLRLRVGVAQFRTTVPLTSPTGI